MTQEEKQLLLRDLCARLPYGVKLGFENSNVVLTPKDYCCFTRQLFTNMVFPEHDGTVEYGCQFYEYRPYLRPMSSMTEEERKELSKILNYEFYIDDDFALVAEDDRHRIRLELCEGYVDWLNANHFDYRIDPSTGKTLIKSNLAIEAPKDMYKNE